ncbi:MAG: hypothetical protein JWO56_725 [Acidobacteria bacterium]|nr:hypothetical protein [Acidobacteriota bacterium]
MLKPVSILTLDDPSAALAEGVQRRIAAAFGLDDLVQTRAFPPGTDLAQTIESIHARRQAPDSAMRARQDIADRELVLVVLAAAGPGRSGVLDLAQQIRQLYQMRRLAEFFTIEILCLLPDLFPGSVADDYGATYSLLKMLSAAGETKPFDSVWLLDSTNANRVKFGRLEQSMDAYVEALAGALTFEPELSGALPGAFRPRQMDATFGSFGYAELVFPRDVALRRVEPRLAAELLRGNLLATGSGVHARLAAKQFVVADDFALPLARIGVEAGQSLFRRFQPKTFVTEKTRGAEEVIAAVRSELKVHRDKTHVQNLQALATQGDQTTNDLSAQLSHLVDGTLDRAGYQPAVDVLEALLDPLPDLRSDAELAPRNLVTEINTATAALDVRLRFAPNIAASDATRKRIREVDNLLQDQQLVADVLAPSNAPDQLAAMEQEKSELTAALPDTLFAEENENNAARNAARVAEEARLAEETVAREQQLRELFDQRPRAEQALREALEARRAFLWHQTWTAILGVAAFYGLPYALGGLLGLPYFRGLYEWGVANHGLVNRAVLVGLTLFTIRALLRYRGSIAPQLRAAREQLQRIQAQIEVTDKAKNNAHNDELQFEYDVMHRRTTLGVLRRTREAAKKALDLVRARRCELEELADALDARSQAASIHTAGLSISIVDDADVDAWYAGGADDRKLLFREFPEVCMTRSQSRHLSAGELQQQIETYAAGAFTAFRKRTIAQIATGPEKIATEATVAQKLKRLTEYSAPLIEVRDDDFEAQKAMQRDTTLWIDTSDAAFVSLVRRRLPVAELRTPRDPLRIHALSRVLHYPAYVIGQIEYYRAQYDAAKHPESADVPDLLPNELALTGAVRTAYEQVLLGRAVGVIHLRADGQLERASGDLALGESHLAAAQRLASSSAAALRHDLEVEIAPRIAIGRDVERDLRQLLETVPPLSAFDRNLVGALIKRYAPSF